MAAIESKKALRGLILHRLYINYPHGILEQDLRHGFYTIGFLPQEVDKALQFVVDKGYVIVEKKDLKSLRLGVQKVYRLTPKGIALCEGEIEDKLIILPKENG